MAIEYDNEVGKNILRKNGKEREGKEGQKFVKVSE